MASRRSARRSSGHRTTRRAPGKKHGRRALLVGGLAAGAAALVGAAVLLTSKKAHAAPLPAPTPTPSGPPVLDSALKQSAHDMNQAIDARGYNLGDAQFYKDFQSAAGLKADGYPGQKTYKALIAALATIPEAPSSNLNAAYTFLDPPGFNGISAPTTTQWFGASYSGSTAAGAVADPSAYRA